MNARAEAPLDGIPWLLRLIRLGADRPWPVLLAVLLLSLLALLGTQRSSVDSSTTRLLDRDGIAHQAYLHIAREFGSDRRNLIYVSDEAIWTPERLQVLAELHQALQRLPFVERVDSIFSATAVAVGNGQGHGSGSETGAGSGAGAESLRVQLLLPAVPRDAAAAAAARQRVLADPLAVGRWVSRDGKALVLAVALREAAPGSTTDAAIEALLQATLTPLQPSFAQVFQRGPAQLEAALERALWHDLKMLAPLFALVLWAVTWLFCRSAFAATLPLLVAALSLLWTAGAMGFIGRPLDVLAVLLPLLTTFAGTTQVLRQAAGNQGAVAAPREPARHRFTEFMVRDLGLPLLLTVAMLALGFAGMAVLLDTAALRDFGLAALIGVLSSGLLALWLVPALTAILLPRPGSRHGLVGGNRLAALSLLAIAGLQRRSVRGSLLLLAVLGVVTLLQQAPTLVLANDPLSYLRADHALLEAGRRLQADLGGPQLFYVTLDADVEGAFREPANVNRLADIQTFIARQQVFDRSLSLADLAAQANQAAGGGRPEAYRVPATRRLVAQALLPHAPSDLAPFVSHDWRRANIVVRHNLHDSSTLNRYVDELRQAASRFAGPGMIVHVTGENLLVNAAAAAFPAQQFTLVGLLLLAVCGVMSALFTSLRGGLVALLPGLVTLAMLLGLMLLLQIPLGAASLVAAVLTVGITLEGSVHLFSRYSTLTRSMSVAAALRETVRREAAPLLAIALTLAASSAVWLASGLALVAQFAALASALLLLSALANLLLLPLLLARIRPVGLYEMLALPMQREALEASPLFQGMSDFQIRKTILISELVEVADGARLIERGSLGRSMYLVVSGELEVICLEQGQLRRTALLGPGDVTGEIGFVRETRRTADVRALGAASLLRFDYARLKKDLAYFPYLMNLLNFNISGILGQRLAELVEAQAAEQATTADAAQAAEQATTADVADVAANNAANPAAAVSPAPTF